MSGQASASPSMPREDPLWHRALHQGSEPPYGVMNKRLADRPYLAGEYSIADMASYPWVVPYERYSQDLNEFPHLKRWFEAIKARPASPRSMAP